MKRLGDITTGFLLTVRYWVSPRGIDENAMVRIRPWMVTAWGLGYGLLFCGVFAASWKAFGDIYFSESSRLRLVPITMVVLVGGILGFRGLIGLAATVDRLVEGREGRDLQGPIPCVGLAGQAALVLILLTSFAGLLAVPYHTPWLPGDWRRHFAFLYPALMHSRVLILLGLWSAAGLLIAAATGPTAEHLAEPDRRFRRKMTIRSLIGNLLFTFLVTAVYFSSSRNRGIGILVSFVIFLVVYLFSMVCAWRLRGHDRFTMFACGQLAALLLLFGYLAVDKYL